MRPVTTITSRPAARVACESPERLGPQQTVLPHERAVEIGRDDVDVAREVFRK